jgi:heavy metal translocating P-type ATPase
VEVSSDPIRPTCSLVHAVRGRVRLRIGRPELLDGLADSLEAFLRDQPGVQAVRLNLNCRSIVLHYDADLLTAENLLSVVDTLPFDALRRYQSRPRPAQVDDSPSVAWLPLALSSAAVALGLLAESAFAPWMLVGAALPIFSRALKALSQKGKLNIDVLDATATTVLLLHGQVQTAGVMVWLVSLGDFIRDVTRQGSQRAIESLFNGKVQAAWVLRDERKVRVQVEDIQEGDEIVVYPGELIPVDGTVILGKATVDQKILTGESMPVEKSEGDYVYAATVVREGKLYFRAAKIGEDTLAAKVVELVRDSPLRETRMQNYAERFADRVVPWSLLGATGAFLGTGNVNAATPLLIVDYGTGIRVAAPTTVLSSMAKGARHGILIKGGRYLERLAEVDAMVFDKTGTLTRGRPQIIDVILCSRNGLGADDVLRFAAAAQQRLTHPIAEAMVRAARARGLQIPERDDSEYLIGLGIEARVEGSSIHVGNERFMTLKGISLARATASVGARMPMAAAPIFVAIDGEPRGTLLVADPLRPEARAVVQALRERGVRDLVMLTGDHTAVAKATAEAVGITRYIAEALPDQKAELVRLLQAKGRTVAVVGDGINDSPALAQADVGIAVRGGAEVAQETAHVTLLEGNLWKIPQAIDIARESVEIIQQNWQLIFYPNTAAIALALTGLIGPIGATLISNGSTVVAAANALRPLLAGPSLKSRR